jgi:hypothetical protein
LPQWFCECSRHSFHLWIVLLYQVVNYSLGASGCFR